ncbi:PREDICTED: differentially expressed in FDCP 8 homolog [Drosophila arizonae]|uniref:Differentially expressed in FDCP 8 homolog n=1 Tax=Drosophila arizonae TaxID=7263 RepID=A0ABM1P721_DROAR|nr:PREDICTED: differentially expressed in FDCP 8 homolog [Drosophila arizonae]
MSSWRESITNLPTAVAQFVNESTSTASSYLNLSHSSSTVSEESAPQHTDYKALPIPASLVKEQWRLIFTSDANSQDLQAAIAHCRDLVLLSDECSEERRWLVRHLVDLRYSLQELEEAQAVANTDVVVLNAIKSVVGHHFVPHHPNTRNRLQAAAKRYYCDHCAGIIWRVVQAAYICSDCSYLVHQKCIDSVQRVCAHVLASDRQYPIADICPEIGLAAQRYKCAECSTLLNFKNSWIEPRLCDYRGLYYCPSCHWNDSFIVPARIVHNWDFTPRKVSRTGLQEIQLFLDKPLIRLEEENPKLFVFLEKLCTVKKLRQNLVHMRHYLAACKDAAEQKLVDQQLGRRRHLAQSNEFYSIGDLVQVESGVLAEFLQGVFKVFGSHIRSCEMCLAKAYICEICSNNEVIFPFDDGCIKCDQCNSIYHRVCFTRKNMICPKCVRIQERRLQLQRDLSKQSKKGEDENAEDSDSALEPVDTT